MAELVQDTVILRHIVRADEAHVDTFHRHDLADVLHALAGFDLAHQDGFFIGPAHIFPSVYSFKIRMRTRKRNAPVSHGRVFGAVHQHTRLFGCFRIGQKQPGRTHLHEFERVLPAHLRDTHQRGHTDAARHRNDVRRLARGERAVLAVHDEEVKPTALQYFRNIRACKCRHHGPQYLLAVFQAFF